MLIRTKRLLLRDYTKQDLENFYRLKSCKEVWNYSSYTPIEDKKKAEIELEERIKKKRDGKLIFMAVFLKDTNDYIGEAGVVVHNVRTNRAVLGIYLLPQYWNQGYATEITKELVKYAFDVQRFERMDAHSSDENIASIRVLSKCGFQYEGTLRNYNLHDKGYRNINYYGITSSEYRRTKLKNLKM